MSLRIRWKSLFKCAANDGQCIALLKCQLVIFVFASEYQAAMPFSERSHSNTEQSHDQANGTERRTRHLGQRCCLRSQDRFLVLSYYDVQ